jgi:hypothetical protein
MTDLSAKGKATKAPSKEGFLSTRGDVEPVDLSATLTFDLT